MSIKFKICNYSIKSRFKIFDIYNASRSWEKSMLNLWICCKISTKEKASNGCKVIKIVCELTLGRAVKIRDEQYFGPLTLTWPSFLLTDYTTTNPIWFTLFKGEREREKIYFLRARAAPIQESYQIQTVTSYFFFLSYTLTVYFTCRLFFGSWNFFHQSLVRLWIKRLKNFNRAALILIIKCGFDNNWSADYIILAIMSLIC